MAQISLYVDDSTASKLALMAKENDSSVSKYVASLISRDLSRGENEEIRKKQVLKELCGALDDPEFTVPKEIPWRNEIKRNYNQI